MTLRDLDRITDNAERFRIQQLLLRSLGFWPRELTCDGLGVDCSLPTDELPAKSFGVYQNSTGDLKGCWFMMRIRRQRAKLFAHIMPGFPDLALTPFARRTTRIVHHLLFNPIVLDDGRRLQVQKIFYTIIRNLDRPGGRDKRTRDLQARAVIEFTNNFPGLITVTKTVRPALPEIFDVAMERT